MKHFILFILLCCGCQQAMQAQGTVIIRGTNILFDPSNRFLVSWEYDRLFEIRTYLDTINYTDSKGLRQGWWLEFEHEYRLWNPDVEEHLQDTTTYRVTHDSLPEEIRNLYYPTSFDITFWGKYVNGKREGRWVSYHDNGYIWKGVWFKQGVPIGTFLINYSNGKGILPRITGRQETDTHHRLIYRDRDMKVIEERLEESSKISFDVEKE